MKIRTKTTKNVELLKATVEAWKAKVDKPIEELRFGPSSCPLCEKYYTNRECHGCPISTYTGRGYCSSTPYAHVMSAIQKNKPLQPEIKKEITFLEKLLHIHLDIEAHEHSMALAELTDNAYHISGRYDEDRKILDNLKSRAKKGQD